MLVFKKQFEWQVIGYLKDELIVKYFLASFISPHPELVISDEPLSSLREGDKVGLFHKKY